MREDLTGGQSKRVLADPLTDSRSCRSPAGAAEPRLFMTAFPRHAPAQPPDTPLVSHRAHGLRLFPAHRALCRRVMELDVRARETTGLCLHDENRSRVATVSSDASFVARGN